MKMLSHPNENIPSQACYKDQRIIPLTDVEATKDKIWQIGGERGWYYATWLWKIRGYADKVFGGVGFRQGRTHPFELSPGDRVDFWRVWYANREEGRLLLFAEMNLPGDAWLEFNIREGHLTQTATFLPRGLLGKTYWYAVLPLHNFIFDRMLRELAN